MVFTINPSKFHKLVDGNEDELCAFQLHTSSPQRHKFVASYYMGTKIVTHVAMEAYH
jgi:hypothetical protein